ncbi:MAG TPA: hypothetical protein VLJ57_05340 [Burkholderiaceae bacterium]|nr:hypothetical protein [Burkholderiaceae bacterium]
MTQLLLLERFLRICCFTLLGALLVLVLTACGPGSGGTGTGPTSFTSASSGSTPGGGAAGSPRPTIPGPLGPCGRVDLQIQEGRVEVVTRCGNLAFVGAWGAGPDGQVVLPGTLENPSAGISIRAVLRLQFPGTPEASSSVIVTITDEAGQVLVGPEELERVESLPSRGPG